METISRQGIPRRHSRARAARRMSRPRSPGLDWLTRASGSPVAKWTTSSTSRLVYGAPQRRIGRSSMRKLILRARHEIPSSHRGRANDREARSEDEDVYGEYDESERRSIAVVQPAECRGYFVAGPNGDTQYTPTVVVAANSWNGLTPLTPSQGYGSQGGSRSPSSLSRNPGTKNSRVSVVNRTRPVLPWGTTRFESSKSTTSMTARGWG